MENNKGFILSTDDYCDLDYSFMQSEDIFCIKTHYTIDGKLHASDSIPPADFYNIVRSGVMPGTVQVNIDEGREYFKKLIGICSNILHLPFSSGISGTYNSMKIAAEEVMQENPGVNIIVVNTLAVSLGLGLLVCKANDLKKTGASMQEVNEYVEKTKNSILHFFTVDSLMHLHRGGRVSRTSAIAGSVLGIKPILKVDPDGKLINIDKVRGRKASLEKIVDNAVKLSQGYENDSFMISHGDCINDAMYVAEYAAKLTGIEKYTINYVGPCIGSHTGPGVVAFFMLGKKI